MRYALFVVILLCILTACGTPQTIVPVTAVATAKSQLAPVITATAPSVLVPTTVANMATATNTPPATQPPAPIKIRVMSYNVLMGANASPIADGYLAPDQKARYANKNRLSGIVKLIQEINPDILGIQEAAGWDSGTPSIVEKFASELGMEHFLGQGIGPGNQVLLSKYPISNMMNLSFYVGMNGALRGTLLAPDGKPINVFVAHLYPFDPAMRLNQLDTLLRRAEPFVQERSILIGDMNFRPSSPESAILEQAGWKLVAVQSCGQIDQIWLAPSIAAYKVVVLPISVSADLSDHLPIVADITIYPSPELTPISTPASVLSPTTKCP